MTLPTDPNATLSIITFVLLVSIGFITLSILIMVFFFDIPLKKALKNKKGILGILLLSVSIPVSVYLLSQNTQVSLRAQKNDQITSYNIKREQEEYTISFRTVAPTLGYLESVDEKGQIRTYLPEYKLEPRTVHSVSVDAELYESSDAFYIIAGSYRQEI